MALSQLQTDAYRAVLRAVAATQLDWVRDHLLGLTGCKGCATRAVHDDGSLIKLLTSLPFARDVCLAARSFLLAQPSFCQPWPPRLSCSHGWALCLGNDAGKMSQQLAMTIRPVCLLSLHLLPTRQRQQQHCPANC